MKLDKILDESFAVSSKQMTLDIKDFSAQLIVPAMQAFVDKIDKYLITLQSEVTNRVNSTNAKADMIVAREYLTTNAVPHTNSLRSLLFYTALKLILDIYLRMLSLRPLLFYTALKPQITNHNP